MPSSDTQFRKGQSGNPNGRPPLSPEIKRLRKELDDQVLEVFLRYGHLTNKQIKKVENNPELSVKERTYLRVIRLGLNDDKIIFYILRHLFKGRPDLWTL